MFYQLDKDDPDILVVIYKTLGAPGEEVVAARRFRRVKEDQARKISVLWIIKTTYHQIFKQVEENIYSAN